MLSLCKAETKLTYICGLEWLPVEFGLCLYRNYKIVEEILYFLDQPVLQLRTHGLEFDKFVDFCHLVWQ